LSAAPLPVAATCAHCGRSAAPGKRVAIWQEEEKGRLGARPLALCDACHAAFLDGRLTRVEIARAWHAAQGKAPHGWIGRIDRDPLLDIVCLECGVLLDVATGATPVRVVCASCGSANRLAARGAEWLTVEIES